MKELLKSQMKQIIGGLSSPPASSCSVKCNDGTIGTKDCGYGVQCYADTDNDSVICGSTVYCVCDGHDIPNP